MIGTYSRLFGKFHSLEEERERDTTLLETGVNLTCDK